MGNSCLSTKRNESCMDLSKYSERPLDTYFPDRQECFKEQLLTIIVASTTKPFDTIHIDVQEDDMIVINHTTKGYIVPQSYEYFLEVVGEKLIGAYKWFVAYRRADRVIMRSADDIVLFIIAEINTYRANIESAEESSDECNEKSQPTTPPPSPVSKCDEKYQHTTPPSSPWTDPPISPHNWDPEEMYGLRLSDKAKAKIKEGQSIVKTQ